MTKIRPAEVDGTPQPVARLPGAKHRMIWLRRLLTIPLIILFLAIFITLLVVTRLSVSVTDPDFYNDQLRKADAYNWVYDRFLPAALEEIEEDNPDLPIGSSARDDIVSAVRKTLPPEWLQEHTESITSAVIPYVVGDADEFTIAIPLKARVELGSQVIKDDLLQGDAAADLYNDVVESMAEQVMKSVDNLPYDLRLTEESVEDALRTMFSEEWVMAQVGGVVDALTPYLTRDVNTFTIVIDVYELIDPAAQATMQILQTNYDGVRDYVMNEVIGSVVEENLGASVELPFEVSFSRDEIVAALGQVISETWVQSRAEEVILAMAAYVKGGTDRIDIPIYLADSNSAATDILKTEADESLRAIFETLPECSLMTFQSMLVTLPPGTLPDCRPAGQSYEYFKAALGIDVAGEVDAKIGDRLPDSWVLADEQFRESIGPENSEFIDGARGWAASGWTFCDADLRSRLDSGDEETLEDVRDRIADGYSASEADLRQWLADDAEMEMESFDRARQVSHDIRTWLWALWLIPLLLLVAIGLLGGRNWRSRLAWPLAILLVTCLAIYIALAVTQARVIEPRSDGFLNDPMESEGMERAVMELGNDLAYNAVSSFISGTERVVLYLAIGSGILILALIVYSVVKQRRHPEPESPATSPDQPHELRPGAPR